VVKLRVESLEGIVAGNSFQPEGLSILGRPPELRNLLVTMVLNPSMNSSMGISGS
jgi:hypothetical protein